MDSSSKFLEVVLPFFAIPVLLIQPLFYSSSNLLLAPQAPPKEWIDPSPTWFFFFLPPACLHCLFKQVGNGPLLCGWTCSPLPL